MIRGFAILFGLQSLGSLLAYGLELPVPGSVIGMVLLLIALRFEWIELQWVHDAAQLLLDNMSFLFIPAGVGVMVYFDLIAAHWLPMTIALVVSTFAVLAVTGTADRWLSQRGGRHER